MQARVKLKYRWKVVTACGGREYIKGEYRPIPTGFEKEAKANPALEVLEGSKKAPAGSPKDDRDQIKAGNKRSGK